MIGKNENLIFREERKKFIRVDDISVFVVFIVVGKLVSVRVLF